MRILAYIVAWGAFSVGYGILAFVLVANLFGREGNSNHLAGFTVAFAIWVTLTLVVARGVRAGKPAERPE